MFNFRTIDNILSEKLDELKRAGARYCKDLTLCQAKVEEFQISETKYESLFDESIVQIKQQEKTLIDSIRKHSQVSSSNFSERILSMGSKLCLL
jgi:hypothetical protein